MNYQVGYHAIAAGIRVEAANKALTHKHQISLYGRRGDINVHDALLRNVAARRHLVDTGANNVDPIDQGAIAVGVFLTPRASEHLADNVTYLLWLSLFHDAEG